MIHQFIRDLFNIRKGEYQISLLMFSYIFIVIAVLLIIKPAVNALFLSELGPQQLPLAFLIVAGAALLVSRVYNRLLEIYSLKAIIKGSLVCSAVVLFLLSVLLLFGWLEGWMLYFFYTWVAIYAVLTASQFWILANLVYSIRDAKRLFGFIGSGGILGGIFGGYLASLLAPFLGNALVLGFAGLLLLGIFPILAAIWKLRVEGLGLYRKSKREPAVREQPWKLIRKSRHLTYMAAIVATSVLAAKLVDYQFSDFAARSFNDPDELTAFFGFWFSTFNLFSLAVQLFLTHRIVGIWGVGLSLLLLPLGILFGSIFFLIVPELSAIVMIKAMDGIMKQSVNKSAFEMLALPLSAELKKKTKAFIDVVIDSLATGVAGILLIFFIKGMDFKSLYVTWLILGVVGLWIFLIYKVRGAYYKVFRENLEAHTTGKQEQKPVRYSNESVLSGMRRVFAEGSESQILFMLSKLLEINDKRFTEDMYRLLEHPSVRVKTEALRNLYYLDHQSMAAGIPSLLAEKDESLNIAVMEYLLMHSGGAVDDIYSQYLDHEELSIRDAALFSLARESRENALLRNRFHLAGRIRDRIMNQSREPLSPTFIKTLGVSGMPEFYPEIKKVIASKEPAEVTAAIEASGLSMDERLLPGLLGLLPSKPYRKEVIAALLQYGPRLIPYLQNAVKKRSLPIETCRILPQVIKQFGDDLAVNSLLELFEDVDLSLRIEVVRALSELRRDVPGLNFQQSRIVAKIFGECQLYHRTMQAMQTQILIYYRNRKKSRAELKELERDARASLMDLLERRLDSGLERIFNLLGLRFPQQDMQIAYEGLMSDQQEARSNAIDFLDNLLTGNLRRKLLPIIEEAAQDWSPEEAVQRIKEQVISERECFRELLDLEDLKLRLAVLYLIEVSADPKYMELARPFLEDPDQKLRDFASRACQAMEAATPSG
ncbi:Npt1/Npt2 family nucleotide transporter [Robiginitalea sp. IMCC43444]|uniref:Npt1/Npt2 family nucleotide transporter n=1 Tax=Robiginitalea sp. IMCC43444 TaxID=3459121 RepID=UPI004041FDCE